MVGVVSKFKLVDLASSSVTEVVGTVLEVTGSVVEIESVVAVVTASMPRSEVAGLVLTKSRPVVANSELSSDSAVANSVAAGSLNLVASSSVMVGSVAVSGKSI